jgi:hypothetical protein
MAADFGRPDDSRPSGYLQRNRRGRGGGQIVTGLHPGHCGLLSGTPGIWALPSGRGSDSTLRVRLTIEDVDHGPHDTG